MSEDDAGGSTTDLSIRHSDGRRQQGWVHKGGEITLPITGGTVDQCSIDYALTLLIGCGPSEHWHFRIEDQFSLEDNTGSLEWIRIHGGTTPGDVNRPINALLHRELERAEIKQNGALRLMFDQGVTVEVAPGVHYEAWNVIGPNNETWVGCPEGMVSVFEPLD